jgi:hypothetical protein
LWLRDAMARKLLRSICRASVAPRRDGTQSAVEADRVPSRSPALHNENHIAMRGITSNKERMATKVQGRAE